MVHMARGLEDRLDIFLGHILHEPCLAGIVVSGSEPDHILVVIGDLEIVHPEQLREKHLCLRNAQVSVPIGVESCQHVFYIVGVGWKFGLLIRGGPVVVVNVVDLALLVLGVLPSVRQRHRSLVGREAPRMIDKI